jgi:cytoskeleton protein RodZ
VLALLPGAAGVGLERVDGGLNTPFRERAGRGADPVDWMPWRRPALWVAAALLVAAAAFVLVPTDVGDLSLGGAEPAAGAASEPAAAASAGTAAAVQPAAGAEPVTATGAAAAAGADPAPAASGAALLPAAGAAGATAAAAAAAAGASGPPAAAAPTAALSAEPATLVLRAVQDTWVQVTDAGGQVLMARTVPAGETVAMSPAPPIRLRIGNVRGTALEYRGRTVDMAASNTGNVANITLP